MPFMFANLAFTILFMVMFEAIQIMYSLWLMPNPLLVFVRNSVFFVMMLLEYCTLVYARTKASITHFPRFIFAGFLCLHLYLLCTPCGFYDIAFAAFASYALGAGLWFVRNCEVPGLRAGVVSDIQPRALDTRVSATFKLESALSQSQF